MNAERFIQILDSSFFTGVPDSQLRQLCDCLMQKYGIDPAHHIIAANEGNCAALAAGYHLATGKIPVVYMQNSGEGNIINPLASLFHEKVYAIPMILVIGWRGEPGVYDEPQHVFQGEITLKMLELMSISYYVLDPGSSEDDVMKARTAFQKELDAGRQVAFVIKKGALQLSEKVVYRNDHILNREDVIEQIALKAGSDIIVSTTGKASRELFEIRERSHHGHEQDFLTVGSMGHASSIALGIAVQKPDRRVWCIDGDGAALMHMGAMAVIGASRPANMIHILINNGAHETVGGMPTVAGKTNMTSVAVSCGYENAFRVETVNELMEALEQCNNKRVLSWIEVLTGIGSRKDLGRPTTTPIENKQNLMKYLQD